MQTEDRYRLCVEALKEYAEGAGFSEALVGLSGGIDSSVVAVMCVDAFGADHVHGVLLPGPYSSDHSCDDALELAPASFRALRPKTRRRGAAWCASWRFRTRTAGCW